MYPISLILLAVAIIVLLIIVFNTFVVVGGRGIAVLERRWFGAKMPQGRVIAMKNEMGIQARTLGPGLHLLIPFIYKARKLDFTVISENEVGIIESIDGTPVPPGKIFAKVVENHNSFQDGEAFLSNGGEKRRAERSSVANTFTGYLPYQPGSL